MLVIMALLLLGTLGAAYGDELEKKLEETREQLNEVRSEAEMARGVVRDYASEVAYYNGLISERAVQLKDPRKAWTAQGRPCK